MICGIDEAGRGPVIGPLVVAGVLIEKKDEPKLKQLGVKDSKELTPRVREELYSKIIKLVKKYHIIIVSPEEIDNAVDKDPSSNLNKLEGEKAVEIINKLKPGTAIIDCPSNNISNFKNFIKNKLKNNTKLILEHKADAKYPSVAAASILAKVTRDKEIEKIKKKIKIDFGSGYPSDPKTIEFVKEHYKTHENIFRKSWQTYKEVLNKKNQTTLGDFSTKDPIIKKLEKLKSLGYEQVPVKTSHEIKRLKGKCMVTYYKTGKVLIQGKEEQKKMVEDIIK